MDGADGATGGADGTNGTGGGAISADGRDDGAARPEAVGANISECVEMAGEGAGGVWYPGDVEAEPPGVGSSAETTAQSSQTPAPVRAIWHALRGPPERTKVLSTELGGLRKGSEANEPQAAVCRSFARCFTMSRAATR